MFTFYELLHPIYSQITSFLEKHINWYLIVLVFACFYELVVIICNKISERESKKRIEILKSLKERELNFSIKDIISTKEHVDEVKKKREEAIQLIEERKGKPYLIFLLYFIRYYVFLSFFFYFMKSDAIGFIKYLPYLSVIITVISSLTRKTIILWIIMAAILLTFYLKASGTVNIFFFYISIYSLFRRMLKIIKKTNEKETLGDEKTEE